MLVLADDGGALSALCRHQDPGDVRLPWRPAGSQVSGTCAMYPQVCSPISCLRAHYSLQGSILPVSVAGRAPPVPPVRRDQLGSVRRASTRGSSRVMEPPWAHSPGTKSTPLCQLQSTAGSTRPHGVLLQLGNTPKESLIYFFCIWKETGTPSLCPSPGAAVTGAGGLGWAHLGAPNRECACGK